MSGAAWRAWDAEMDAARANLAAWRADNAAAMREAGDDPAKLALAREGARHLDTLAQHLAEAEAYQHAGADHGLRPAPGEVRP